MPNEPSPESIARAARLRAQIDKLTNPEAAASDQPSGVPDKAAPMSPREFIDQQMNKLDRKK